MRFKQTIATKLSRDIAWNLGSFVILGLTGIAINLLIGRYYSPDVLGVFNQVFAFYILLSQFSVLGIQFSVLKYISELATVDREECRRAAYAAMVVAASFSLLVFIVSLNLVDMLPFILESQAVSQGLFLALPGIALFALNKVLINIINGLRHMRMFAIIQSLRYIIIFLVTIIYVIYGFQGYDLPFAFTIAEFILFFLMILYLYRTLPPLFDIQILRWIKEHIVFGCKGFFSGAVSELNTRVDVLMLGVFMQDYHVGLYSMASMLSEGIAQLSVVVRNNINPLITQYLSQHRLDELQAIIRRTVKWFYVAMLIVIAPAILVFPYVIQVLTASASFQESWPVFTILCGGLLFSAGYIPLEMVLIQAGYPILQTLLRAMVLVSNILLNLALIPLWGIKGAALATAVSYLLAAGYLKWLGRRKLRIKI